ncbi:hypothetical protein NUM3379_15220 [Kineococcus sp. NUM-3379]
MNPTVTDEMRAEVEDAVRRVGAVPWAPHGDRRTHPDLWSMLMFLRGEYTEERWLDPREGFEAGMANCLGDLVVALAQWRALKDGAVTEEDFERFGRRLDLLWVGPPEGRSHVRWAEWAEERLVEAIARPETLLPPHEFPCHPHLARSSRCDDTVDEDALVAELIGRREADVTRWLAAPDAGTRLYLTADLGRRIGVAFDRGEAPGAEFHHRATSRFAVVLERSRERGEPFTVLASYPVEPETSEAEKAAAHALRERWPVLEQLFGAFFGQHVMAGPPFFGQAAFLWDQPATLHDAVRCCLPELLSLDETGLRNALRLLGCYVDANHAHTWLGWLLWRMDAFDW